MSSNNNNINLFYYICFFLKHSGYFLKEFPKLLKMPPLKPYEFTYNAIRNKAIKKGMVEDNGTVTYNTRIIIISNFHFIKKNTFINVDNNIDKKFEEISNRNAKFNAMSTDEQIKEIINLLEYLLKRSFNVLDMQQKKRYKNEKNLMTFKKCL